MKPFIILLANMFDQQHEMVFYSIFHPKLFLKVGEYFGFDDFYGFTQFTPNRSNFVLYKCEY